MTARLTPDGENHGTLTIAISDTGCGISEEEQAGLFQRYAQGRCRASTNRFWTGVIYLQRTGDVDGRGAGVDERPVARNHVYHNAAG